MSIPTVPWTAESPILGTITDGLVLRTMSDDGPILGGIDRHFVGGAGSRGPVRPSMAGPIIGARSPVIGGAPARGPVIGG
ncbi:hypothetical protein [Chitinimonas lacunae]|uniref:Uncharacterized protein n=1 Tax=Chitinimonas lacunae TaxID=1963018 RepID=A0ABV8MUP7_9NEIS